MRLNPGPGPVCLGVDVVFVVTTEFEEQALGGAHGFIVAEFGFRGDGAVGGVVDDFGYRLRERGPRV